KERKRSRQRLAERLETASTISRPGEKDKALAAVATSAAKAGEPAIVKECLEKITWSKSRDDAARESARLLASAGLTGQAIETAESITSFVTRDQTLAGLARGAAKAAKAGHVMAALS